MKIKKIKITNFRNLQNVDLELKNINILTGRNGSGKTNFLNAIAHSLETKEQLGSEFNNNITTRGGRGKSSTKISVTMEEVSPICIVNRTNNSAEENATVYFPKTITYINTIGGTDYNSHKQEFFYRGPMEKGDWKAYPAEILAKRKDIKFDLTNNFKEEKSGENKAEESNTLPGFSKVFSNKILENDFARYFFDSNKKNPLYKFIKRLENGVYINEMSSKAIIDYVLAVPSGELYEQIVKRIKQKSPLSWHGDFSNASFGSLLADIQSDENVQAQFYTDLNIYTNGLIRGIYIETNGNTNNNNEKIGNEGMILVETPNAPKWLSSISAGSAVMIFFITLKNWLALPRKGQSYQPPSIMLFDEIDSSMHPTLIKHFIEVLRTIGNKVQLILSSHSPFFINEFGRDEIYYIKPQEVVGNIKHNRSDILSYKQILKRMGHSDEAEFINVKNSELFIDGMIDDLYPIQ